MNFLRYFHFFARIYLNVQRLFLSSASFELSGFSVCAFSFSEIEFFLCAVVWPEYTASLDVALDIYSEGSVDTSDLSLCWRFREESGDPISERFISEHFLQRRGLYPTDLDALRDYVTCLWFYW